MMTQIEEQIQSDLDPEEMIIKKFGEPKNSEDLRRLAEAIIQEDYAMVREKKAGDNSGNQ